VWAIDNTKGEGFTCPQLVLGGRPAPIVIVRLAAAAAVAAAVVAAAVAVVVVVVVVLGVLIARLLM